MPPLKDQLSRKGLIQNRPYNIKDSKLKTKSILNSGIHKRRAPPIVLRPLLTQLPQLPLLRLPLLTTRLFISTASSSNY